LISQRSGIAEYLNASDPNNPGQTILDSWNAANGRYDLTPSQLVAAALTLEQTMPPGDTSTFQYSNTNFLLLGMILEKASCASASGCRSFDEILQQEILTPLGLSETTYPTGTTYDGAHTNATWNQYGVLTDFTHPSPVIPNTAGAMISTVHDQLDWLIELTTNANGTLSPEIFAERLQWTTDLNGNVAGSEAGYGMAIYGSTSATTGQATLGHGGEISGVQTLMFQFPDANLFIVGDVNTFLSVPDDRTLPASSITDLYYGLERSIMTLTAATVNGGSCVGGANATCTGTTVTPFGITGSGNVNIEASGSFWTNTSLEFSEPIPTLTVYGAEVTALSVNDGTVTIKENGIVESIGNGSTALQLGGSQNTVDISGQLNAIGYATRALDGSGISNDTIIINPTGSVTGGIALTQGLDRITANGTVNGDIFLGPDAILSGSGIVNGLLSGGTVAPGNSVGVLTVSTYNGFGSTLQMEIDGSSATADKLKVVEQESEGIPVVDTGTAYLEGATLELSGTRPATDTRLLLLEADNGLFGSFGSLLDNDGLLNTRGRVSGAVLSGSTSVVAAWTSPAPFDAAADLLYLTSLDRADHNLNRINRTNTGLIESRGMRPFVMFLGNYADFSSEDGASGYTIQSEGLMLGVDVPLGNDFLVGLNFATTIGTAQVDWDGEEQESSVQSLGLYGTRKAGEYNIGADFSIGYGDIDYSNKVTIDGLAGIAKGKYDVLPITLGLSVNRAFMGDEWTTDITGDLVYMHGKAKGFTETGIAENAAFTFADHTNERLRAGVTTTFSKNEPIAQCYPWVSLGIFQHFDLNSPDIQYHLPDGATARLEGRDGSGIESRLGIGFRHQLQNKVNLNFSVDGSLREDDAATRMMLWLSIPLDS
jgi:hypothetical protein